MILIRTDGSPQLGIGRVMRCYALAKAYNKDVHWVFKSMPETLLRQFNTEINFTMHQLPFQLTEQEEADAVIKLINENVIQPEWVVLDHFELGIN